MSISVFRVILLVLLHTGTSEFVQRSALFDTKENLKVEVGAMIKRQTSRSLVSCTQDCLSEPMCTSFNYDGRASQGVCELYKEGDEMQLIQEPGWLCGHLLGERKKIVKRKSINMGSFFVSLWTETESRAINTQKKERGQYQAILTEQAWSIKDL